MGLVVAHSEGWPNYNGLGDVNGILFVAIPPCTTLKSTLFGDWKINRVTNNKLMIDKELNPC